MSEAQETTNTNNTKSQCRLKLTYGDINLGNINQLSLINRVTLPVKYSTGFYQEVALKYAKYSRFAYYNDIIIGSFTTRVEPYDNKNMAYILTFVVLETYRKMKIGSQMMKQMEQVLKAETTNKVDGVYLHVHVKNQTAINFYKSQGFIEKERLENYYKTIDEPHALVLIKLFE